jgi:putative ABC transport system permease protein
MRSGSDRALAVRAYACALWLLPPVVRREDAEEMTLAFADLWKEPTGALGKASLIGRIFGHLPWVVVVEWLDLMGITAGDTGGTRMMGWGRNLRFALRTLRKAPAFTVTTVVLIGLGVGAVTTIFTVVDHVLLRPLPYPEAGRLITIEDGSFPGPFVRALDDFNSVELWAAATSTAANLVGEGDPRRIEQATVSRDFFSLFGGRPEVGRLLIEDDFDAPGSVVLSHGLWETVFGANESLIGRSIRIDGAPVTVVGVLRAGFEPPRALVSGAVDVWRPIDWSRPDLERADYWVLEVAGRMAPGVTPADVQGEVDALSAEMARLYPEEMTDRDGNRLKRPVSGMQDATVQRVETGLNLLLGAVALLLLVACLNVAHLFLARGLGRMQEMAVRRALGAGVGGIARQLLVESLVIGVTGGVLGLGVAAVGLRVFLSLNPTALPASGEVGLDLRVALFAGVVSLLTAIVFGLLPGLRAVGGDVTDELKGSSRGATMGRGGTRMRSALVVAEVAVSLVLVAEAGLLMKSFLQVQAHDPGIDPTGVWTIPLTPIGIGAPDEYVAAMNEIEAALAAVPGVRSATYGLTQPFEMAGRGRCCWSTRGLVADGQAHDELWIMFHPVSVPYFETLGLPIVVGRSWGTAEVRDDPMPAVISEGLAVTLFGSAEGAIGKLPESRNGRQFRVVGVAADDKHYGLDQPAPNSIYLPIEQIPFNIDMAHMAVRTEGEAPQGFARSLREAVWRADPDMPIPTVRTMDEWIERSTAGRRFDSVLFGSFGVMGLLLAGAGLYGTLLYGVHQRRRELGIRLALGAVRSRVEGQVVAHGVRLALLGAAVGLVAAWWAGGLLESRLYQVEATDPLTLGAAAALLVGVAAFASWLPARRAGRTNPLETLSAE